MSALRVILLVVALGAACLAAGMVYVWLSRPVEPRPAEAPATRGIVVAAQDLARGHRIGPDDLKVGAWPEDAERPAGSLEAERGGDIPKSLMGRRVRERILEREPILTDRLIGTDGGGMMAATIEPGMRAVSAEVNYERGAGGFILPEDRVDVILSRVTNGPDGQTITIARTVLQNIRVLAIDQTIQTENDVSIQGETITLEVSPEEAEIFAQAQEAGTLIFALRGFDAPDAEREKPLAAAPRTTTIYRFGSSAERVQWEGERSQWQ